MSPDDAAPVSTDPSAAFGKLRVLIADDTYITQAMMMTRLKKLGCEVTVVDNGQAAVEEVKRTPFDCIFMDYHMPILDGVEATRLIRRWESAAPGAELKPKIYIVAFTATSQNSDREHFTAVGMDDFLSKPMSLDDLLGILRRVAGRK